MRMKDVGGGFTDSIGEERFHPFRKRESGLRLRSRGGYFLAMRFSKYIAAALLFTLTAFDAESSWRPLFNGTNFTGWETFLAAPESTWDVPGLKRDEKGNYLEPIGKNRDPLKVFTVATVDSQPAVRISGQGLGVLMTSESFTNFHLRAQFKWGDQRWGTKAELPRDTGILYFCQGEAGSVAKGWPRCVEFQIKEKETGDLYALGTQVTATARDLGTNSWIYDPKGEPTIFAWKRKPLTNRCIKLAEAEKARGEWNTLDLVCSKGAATYTVNGTVTMQTSDTQDVNGTNSTPLVGGRIALQTEGAEVFFRDIEIQAFN